MRAERRGGVARVGSAVNRQRGEEPGERAEAAGQTVSDRQGGGLGSVSTGESQQGCGGGRGSAAWAVWGGRGESTISRSSSSRRTGTGICTRSGTGCRRAAISRRR